MNRAISFKVAIPARFASRRLPGKPLLRIAGKPMLQLVYEQAMRSGAEEVIIATDDSRIEYCARQFGARVCMTSSRHVSGSERVAEVAKTFAWTNDTIVVNLQGDEPLMPPADIRQAAANLAANPCASIATLCMPITRTSEYEDPNVVKVVRDCHDFALYFSRAPIPGAGDRTPSDERLGGSYRHIGLYAYRAGYLKAFADATPCALERIENLEQLRALWRGERVHVAEAVEPPGPGVDTPEDLAAVERLVSRSTTGASCF